MKSLLNFLSRRNVFQQLSSIFLCAVLIPIILFGTVVAAYSCRQLIRSYDDLTESDTMRIRSILLNVTTDFYNTSENLRMNTELTELMCAGYETPADALLACNSFPAIRKLLDMQPSISTLRFYIPDREGYAASDDTYFYPVTEEIAEQEWYQQALSQASHFWKSMPRTEERYGKTYWELNFYRRIPINSQGDFAVLNMTVSDNYLRSLIESNTLSTYISVNGEECFYATERAKAGLPFPVTIDHETTYYQLQGLLSMEGRRVIGTVNTLIPYDSQDKLYILSTDRDSVSYLMKIGFSFLAVLLISTLCPALLVFLFTRYFSSRIRTLRLAMHKVSNNDYELVDAVQGDDELSATFSDLKTMVEKVKKSEAAIYESQIQQQELENRQQQMEFKMLASQINPHFLYNTLETIRMKAFSVGDNEVANAIKLLGKSMRYVLNNTGTTSTTLDKELSYIRTYLAIQKMRFGERLGYEITIDETLDLSAYQILPLLLQPVVENAISHGLEEAEGSGRVTICLQKSGDSLKVSISDNGVGLDETELTRLTEQIKNHPKDSTSSIGLYNINQRIQLFYGSKYGLWIESEKGRGTTVTITIPLHNLTEEQL